MMPRRSYGVSLVVCFLQLRRHFETDTLPWIQRLRQKDQELQRRLLKVLSCSSVVAGVEVKGEPVASGLHFRNVIQKSLVHDDSQDWTCTCDLEDSAVAFFRGD